MALFDVIGELYDPNADVKPRFLVNQGGTSSGKTYTIMQRLIVLSFEHPMAIITVCGQDLPNLKVGAMRDLDTILHSRAELLDWFEKQQERQQLQRQERLHHRVQELSRCAGRKER